MSDAAGPPGVRIRGKGGRRDGEQAVVPEAPFQSYYGRPVVKKPVWKWDIPAYFLTGGLMAGSSLLAAGADVTANTRLRRVSRLAAAANLAASMWFLVHDLGRPGRFHNMLRVVRPTSPMNLGSWLLAAYGPPVALAAGSEVSGVWPRAGRAAGVAAAALAPAVASYTAVLTSDTAVPAWHDAHPHLPFVFVGSAGAAAGGLAMALVPPAQASPARRLAVLGAALELAADERMGPSMGLTGEPYREGTAGRLHRWARLFTAGGAVAGATLARRSRLAAVASGLALVAGSACTRFSVFHAGVQSASDPKYTVVPQRARVDGVPPSRPADEGDARPSPGATAPAAEGDGTGDHGDGGPSLS